MPDYFDQQLYGDYNPYSQTNLQGGLMGYPTQTPFEQVISGDGGTGTSGWGGYDNVGTYSAGAFGDEAGKARAMGPMKGLVGNSLKNMALAGAIGQSPLGGLTGLVTGAPSAVANSITSAAGFSPDDVTSKVVSALGKGALGLMGGPFGAMISPMVDPAVSFGLDALGARTAESLRDDVENSALGEFGGRRAYADFKDAFSKSGHTDKSLNDVKSAQDLADNFAAAMESLQGANVPGGMREVTQALNAIASLQAEMENPTRQAYNPVRTPMGINMGATLQQGMRNKYGVGWSRDKDFNVVSGPDKKGKSGGGFASLSGGERGGQTGSHSGVSGGPGGGRGGFGR